MNIGLSEEAKEMLTTRTGYRNNGLYGSGVVDIREIIEFEATELCNDDIFLTCKKFYGIDYGEIDVGVLENIEGYLNKTMEFLKNHFGTDKLNGKWLGLEQNIMDCYAGEEGITEYPIPEDAIVISDLCSEGVLFVTPNTWVDKYGYV